MTERRHLHLVKTVWPVGFDTAPGTPAPVAGAAMGPGMTLVASPVGGTTVVPGRNGIKYGAKYVEDLDVAEIAKLVRADIKAGVAAGELPAAKYGVRISRYSMGRSLNVTIDEVPFTIPNEARVKHDVLEPHAHHDGTLLLLTPEASALKDKVEALVDAYNFDGSDSQTDYSHVNFYGHVNFGRQESREWEALRAKYETEKAALRAHGCDLPGENPHAGETRAAILRAKSRASCPARHYHDPGAGCSLCEG